LRSSRGQEAALHDDLLPYTLNAPMGLPGSERCTALAIASDGSRATIGTHVLDEGDWLSLDGESGEIFLGEREIIRELPEMKLATIETWKLKTDTLDSPRRPPTRS